MTRDELIAFEKDMAAAFERGEIRSPLHLAGGNEDELIGIFKSIEPQDWICCSWRSHYHALLKGVPPDEVKAAILRGRSIALCFPAYRMLSSAIVGGNASIAVGIAMAIKRKHLDDHVWCFIGDMTLMTGIVHESLSYACAQDLPVTFVLEDNGKSVSTNTREAWGKRGIKDLGRLVTAYQYELTWPHVGIGKFVRF